MNLEITAQFSSLSPMESGLADSDKVKGLSVPCLRIVTVRSKVV